MMETFLEFCGGFGAVFKLEIGETANAHSDVGTGSNGVAQLVFTG